MDGLLPPLSAKRSIVPPSPGENKGDAMVLIASHPRSLPSVSIVTAPAPPRSTDNIPGPSNEARPTTVLRRRTSNVAKMRDENAAHHHHTIAPEVSEGGVSGLRAMFNQFDKDGDGALDATECADALRAFGIALNPSDLKELIYEVDVSELDGTRTRSSAKESSNAWTDSDDDEVTSVDFDKFVQILAIWQSAARFRLFETRDDETQAHLEAKRTTRFLLPDSHATSAWNVVQLVASLAAFCIAIATHMMTLEGLAPFFVATTGVEVIFTVLFAADLVVRFFVVDSAVLQQQPLLADDRAWITAQYMQFWFWVDLVSMIPFRFLFVFGGSAQHNTQIDTSTGYLVDPSLVGCQLTACRTESEYAFTMVAAKVVLHLRIFKYMGHIRYFEESGFVPLTKAYIAINFVVGHGLVALSRLLALVHVCAIAYNSFELGDTSYVRGLYVVLYCFSTVGYGDQRPDTDNQRMYFVFLVVIGSLLNAYFIGAFVNFFQRSDIGSNQSTTLLQVDALLAYFDIPVGLREEVLGFESHVVSTDLLSTYTSTVVELPADIRHNLELAARLRVISALPYFEDVHRGAKLQLCNALCRLTCVPEEYVLFFGELGEEMFFLTHGFMDVLTEQNTYLVTLKPGSYFGEMAVLYEEPVQRAATVKSISYCELYVLAKERFLEVVYKYPRLKVAVEATAAARKAELGQVLEPLSPADSSSNDDHPNNTMAPGMSFMHVNSVPATPLIRKDESLCNTAATSDDGDVVPSPRSGGISWVARNDSIVNFQLRNLDLRSPGVGMACSVRSVFQEQMLKSAAQHVRRKQSIAPTPRGVSAGGGGNTPHVPIEDKVLPSVGDPHANHVVFSSSQLEGLNRSGCCEAPPQQTLSSSDRPLKVSSILSRAKRQQSMTAASMLPVRKASLFYAPQFAPTVSMDDPSSDSIWLREVELSSHENLARLLVNIHQEARSTQALLRDLLMFMDPSSAPDAGSESLRADAPDEFSLSQSKSRGDRSSSYGDDDFS